MCDSFRWARPLTVLGIVLITTLLVQPTLGASFSISGSISLPLTGVVTVGPGSTVVTGTGTVFSQELQIGDSIRIAEEEFTVAEIVSDVELHLDDFHSTGALGVEALTAMNLWEARSPDGKQAILDGRGDLRLEGSVGAVEYCDENGLNCRRADRVVGKCPDGYTAVTEEFCIEIIARTPPLQAVFGDAAVACAREGAHLCSRFEWAVACRLRNELSPPPQGLDDALGELVAGYGDSASIGNVVMPGFGNGCVAAQARTNADEFRCCYSR